MQCDECGEEYTKITTHWSLSNCNHPKLTETQREILTGLVMGDGSVIRVRGRNPYISVSSINRVYLEYLNEEFPVLKRGISLHRTAEEQADLCKSNGFDPAAKEENYNDIYTWKTRSNPNLDDFASWYFIGDKIWPSSINLTPTILKHWYCGDGSFNNIDHRRYISIGVSNEHKNKEKIEQYFQQGPGIKVSNWNETWKDGDCIMSAIQFTQSQTRELFEYMGDPLPGFEHKWPQSFRSPDTNQCDPKKYDRNSKLQDPE